MGETCGHNSRSHLSKCLILDKYNQEEHINMSMLWNDEYLNDEYLKTDQLATIIQYIRTQ